MIIFPVSFLLIQIFRRSRVQISQFARLKKLFEKRYKTREFNQNNTDFELTDLRGQENNTKITKRSRPFLLPWWCKIVGYVLSFMIVGASAFFIIVQGITFGEDKVSRWLTSFITSVLASIFLTQPIQVKFPAIFCPFYSKL